MHPIVKAQYVGDPLPKQEETKVDYLLKSKSGRTVMAFDHNSLQRAKEEAESRKLTLFRVTTFTEKL